MPASVAAWQTWFVQWYASHWTPGDLPGLRKVIQLYDLTERGEAQRFGEYRLSADGYGITPRGRQVLHWEPPKEDEPPKAAEKADVGPYAHLRAV